jgi:hypothetical protein
MHFLRLFARLIGGELSAHQVGSGLLHTAGIQRDPFCEAIGLQPADFDFEAGILEVARSVVKVSRQHHPQGKTFLVRDYTKNGQTRRLKLDQAVVELVRGHVAEHGIGEAGVIFPAELVVPPRRTMPRVTEQQLRALGDCDPVGGADRRSLAMLTSPIWTSRAGIGSGPVRSRRAESRSSRPLTRSGIRTPRG